MSPQGPIQTGTIATYTCDNGYELLGPARRSCNENGTWTPLGIPFCGKSPKTKFLHYLFYLNSLDFVCSFDFQKAKMDEQINFRLSLNVCQFASVN